MGGVNLNPTIESYIPIFIIVHNHFEILKSTVDSYISQIKTPFRIIFHDVCSTYEPTLNYLKAMKQYGFSVYRSEINHHHTVIMTVKDYMTKNKHLDYYVITDPDIKLYNVNGDILEYYIHLLNTYNVKSVGPMLKIDDIPDFYPRKKNVIDTHYKQFWSKTPIKIKYKNNEFEIIKCPTDTTFQLSSIKNPPESFPHQNSIRCLHPYSAQHLDWYIDPNNLTPCQKYYMETTTQISHWANPNWKGHDMCGNKIQDIVFDKMLTVLGNELKGWTNFVENQLLLCKEQKIYEANIMLKLPYGTSFLDVGANYGDTVLTMAAYAKSNNRSDIRFYAFEPNINKVRHIKNISTLNKLNVIIYNTCVGNDRTKASLDKLENISACAGHASFKLDDTGTYEIIRLDDIKSELEPIGYIHIDTEGWDCAVLKGCHKILDNPKNSPMYIIVECWNESVAKNEFERGRAKGVATSTPKKDIMDEMGLYNDIELITELRYHDINLVFRKGN